MTTHFTADTHFHHRAQAERRGFATVEEMNECIVRDWNARVCPGDTVYHLGDLSYNGSAKALEIVRRLNGHIHIVPGNHDQERVLIQLSMAHRARDGCSLNLMPPLMDLKMSRPMPDGSSEIDRFTLCHFPLLVWNRSHYGAMHLHGHSHGNLAPRQGRVMDVGVDTHPFSWGPYSLAEVLVCMKDKGYIAHDHHKERADPA